ncbi:polyadenylate-binding protein [Stylonychia lemnae]|uniref:Polyadenylate-binding protein n=1 Tax=Stylonychia lemnae TaxID=5949 RepID=A0A078ATT6_STYLE|nr:polyadenylate-binding protein [Stylonychia lemnae]|eukprot:CDW85840.1 polyadenylate-binding protein [Stylonychia lemnae]
MNDRKQPLLYLYDLPKDKTTSVLIASILKEQANYEISEAPQIKRVQDRPFYTAIVKINDPNRYDEICQKLKFFQIDNKECRALPYMKELTAAYRSVTNQNNNIFIKGIDKNKSQKDLEKRIMELLGQQDIVSSLKISITPDHKSNGYGYVLFKSQELVEKALKLQEEGLINEMLITRYQPKDRRDMRKAFNNIYIKNIPAEWKEENLRQLFSKYGHITSLALIQAQIPGQPEGTTAPIAFIAFGDPAEKDKDPEIGIKSANTAVNDLHDVVFDGQKLYVQRAMGKEEREQEKKREQLRFKKSKQRCNLYVKNFPPNTTEQQLRDLFGSYGEIESLKLLPKEGEALYAFICFVSPDSAALAKQQLHLHSLNGKQLYINNYELKEVRQVQQEAAQDQAGFQNYKKQQPAPLTLEILNKPEIYQLIQYLMITLKQQQNGRQGGNQNPRYNNNNQRTGGQRTGGYNNHQQIQQQQMQGIPNNQQQQNMMQHQQMRQQPPVMPPQQMMHQQIPVQQIIPQQIQNLGLPPHIIQYQVESNRIIPAVIPQNPNYKQNVGEFIYDYVEQLSSEIHAPKITGMLIELPIPEIQAFLKDYNRLDRKVKEAHTLLQKSQEQ